MPPQYEDEEEEDEEDQEFNIMKVLKKMNDDAGDLYNADIETEEYLENRPRAGFTEMDIDEMASIPDAKYEAMLNFDPLKLYEKQREEFIRNDPVLGDMRSFTGPSVLEILAQKLRNDELTYLTTLEIFLFYPVAAMTNKLIYRIGKWKSLVLAASGYYIGQYAEESAKKWLSPLGISVSYGIALGGLVNFFSETICDVFKIQDNYWRDVWNSIVLTGATVAAVASSASRRIEKEWVDIRSDMQSLPPAQQIYGIESENRRVHPPTL